MRQLLSTFFTLLTLTSFAQTVKDLHPTLGELIDKSREGEIEFNKQQEICNRLFNTVSKPGDYEKLSPTDKKIYDNCDESYESYWDILGLGCSWYCGGGQDTLSASSTLKSNKEINYSAKNMHDLNSKTAWIEGVPGYGIGESITYHFPPQNPRITEIILINGYVKSLTTWKDNSRVKKLKMYVDNKLFAILNVVDSRQEQHFKIEPLGYSDRENWEELESKPWWTITFEILEVYKGDKYDDTAITEIYFDGIDVH
jgi:hypothetical protein